MKVIGGFGFRRTRFPGLARTGLAGHLVGVAYNLIRMSRLIPSNQSSNKFAIT
jgi:hypothetical protein